MGIGAAMAFYEENSSWLTDVDDAYSVLYGDDDKPAKAKNKTRCPKCGNKMKSIRGVGDHLRDYHKIGEARALELYGPEYDKVMEDGK